MKKTGKRTDPNTPQETGASSLVDSTSQFETRAGCDLESLHDAASATAAIFAESDRAMNVAAAKACSLMLDQATSRYAAVAAAAALPTGYDSTLRSAALAAKAMADNPAIRLAELASKWEMARPALKLAEQASKIALFNPALDPARALREQLDFSPALKLAELMATDYHSSSLAGATVKDMYGSSALKLAELTATALNQSSALKLAALSVSALTDNATLRAAAQAASAINDDWRGLAKAFVKDSFAGSAGLKQAAAAVRSLEDANRWALASEAMKTWSTHKSPLLAYLSSNDSVDFDLLTRTEGMEWAGATAKNASAALVVNPELETEIVGRLESGQTIEQLPAPAKTHLRLYLWYLYQVIQLFVVIVGVWQAIDFLETKLASVDKPAEVKEAIAQLPDHHRELLAGYRVVTAGSVMLRIRCSASSDSLARLQLGDVLEVLEETEAWVKVSVDVAGESREGWVYRRYTAPIQPKKTSKRNSERSANG